jgi:hypothetical protein
MFTNFKTGSLILALLLGMLGSVGFGGSFNDDFAAVFIDAASEAELGAFPLDRSFLAKAVRQAADQGAKGVVLKFFFDQPREEAGDAALALALTNLPVLLQARIDDSEANPHALPARFTLPGIKVQTAISGTSGWIPLPRLSANARDVGFVDFDTARVPLLETYQSRTVKSLVVCCIELATDKPAVITPSGKMKFGAGELKLDDNHCMTTKLPEKDELAYLPFHQFLAGETPAAQLKGKVVIIGYDGPKIQTTSTRIGPIRAHRFFVYALRSVYERVGK